MYVVPSSACAFEVACNPSGYSMPAPPVVPVENAVAMFAQQAEAKGLELALQFTPNVIWKRSPSRQRLTNTSKPCVQSGES